MGIAVGLVALVGLLIGVAVLIVGSVRGSETMSSGSSTGSTSFSTPLGCPTPVPAAPTSTEEPALECTERALVGRVCDLNPEGLTDVVGGGAQHLLIIQLRNPENPFFRANFTYNTGGAQTTLDLSCTVPAGGHTRRGQVTLGPDDWRTLVSPGTELPAELQPAYLNVRPETTASTASSDPTGDACSVHAQQVFVLLARHQITLAQAQRQLPPGFPPSQLTISLQGVQNYEHDGLSRDDAISEASGAVGQACPR